MKLCSFAIFFLSASKRCSLLKIFDSEKRSFENKVLESLETTENLFANKAITAAIDTASLIPELGAVFTAISAIRGILEEESDWRAAFAKTITDQVERGNVKNLIVSIDAKLRNIQEQF